MNICDSLSCVLSILEYFSAMNLNQKLVLTFAIIFIAAAVAGGIAWLVFLNPPELKVTVTNASLSQFNLNDNTDTLHYNLALNVTTRNTNRFDVIYTRIRAIAKYGKQTFATVTLRSPLFKQHHKNTTILQYPVLQGQQSVRFSESDLSRFNSETKAGGVYSIDVVVVMRIKRHTSKYYNCEWTCSLKLPLNSNQTPFNATQCSFTQW